MFWHNSEFMSHIKNCNFCDITMSLTYDHQFNESKWMFEPNLEVSPGRLEMSHSRTKTVTIHTVYSRFEVSNWHTFIVHIIWCLSSSCLWTNCQGKEILCFQRTITVILKKNVHSHGDLQLLLMKCIRNNWGECHCIWHKTITWSQTSSSHQLFHLNV